jgi:hypothetical protein
MNMKEVTDKDYQNFVLQHQEVTIGDAKISLGASKHSLTILNLNAPILGLFLREGIGRHIKVILGETGHPKWFVTQSSGIPSLKREF